MKGTINKYLLRFNGFFAHRQHPLKLFIYISKNLWLLLIPLGKYLIATRFDFQSWIKTNWLDILVFGAIFAIAFLRWFFVYFETDENSLTAHHGPFGLMKTRVFFNEITTCSCCQDYIERLFNAATLYIKTNATSVSASDVKLVISKKAADEVYGQVTRQCEGKVKRTVKTKKRYLTAFSVLFSSTLAGVIVFISVMFQIYQLVGKELEQTLVERVNGEIGKVNSVIFRLTNTVPRIIVIIIYIVAICWAISFVSNLIRHWNFEATRCGSQLLINSGMIIRRKHALNRSKFVYIDYEKNLLMRLFKVSSVNVCCAGYGAKNREFAALIPITTQKEVRKSLEILIPDLPHSSIDIKTGGIKDVFRFIALPFFMSFIPHGANFVIKLFISKWHYEINVITAIALIPFVWKIIVSIVAAYNTSIGFDDIYCTLRYCKMFHFHKVLIPKENISKVEITQTVFQKASRMCNIRVYSKSRNMKKHLLRNLPLEQARQLCKDNGFNVD